ncbi:MAG: hypothetical protein JWQ35_268 [Bacteriovoracaceae bacterium]|nr:hypothetical protein [Bacteriovoracaceae bacterium]
MNSWNRQSPKELKDIYSYCIDLLSRRAYSTFKLSWKLKQKKYPANEIEVVLKILIQDKYLRDDLYAEGRTRTWMSKGNSISQIKRMLSQEKLFLSTDRIGEIFGECDRSEAEQMKALVGAQMKKVRQMPTDRKELYKLKQKMGAALMRKGHSFSLINAEIDRQLKA